MCVLLAGDFQRVVAKLAAPVFEELPECRAPSLPGGDERVHVNHAVAVSMRLLRPGEGRYVRLPGVADVDRVGRVPVISDMGRGRSLTRVEQDPENPEDKHDDEAYRRPAVSVLRASPASSPSSPALGQSLLPFSALPPGRAPKGARYLRSSAFTFSTFASSLASASAENQASRMPLAASSDVLARLRQRTFAWFQARAPRAVSASAQSAARIPGSLFAAIDTPVPVQQKSTPKSDLPSATRSATASATSGQGLASPAGGPNSATSAPPRRRSASPNSVRGERSSLPRAMRKFYYRTRGNWVTSPVSIICAT